MLSVNRLPDGNCSYAYVVACQLPDGKYHRMTKSKKFDCNGDDIEAQTKAIWFAKATDSLAEFRAFLFEEPGGSMSTRSDGTMTLDTAVGRKGNHLSSGVLPVEERESGSEKIRVRSFVCMREKQLTGVRYAVAMCRLENGRLRSISFCRCRSVAEGHGTGDDHLLEKAVHFLRGAGFENWRRQLSRDSHQKLREQAGGSHCKSGKERGLKHPHSFVELDQGEKVDCVCGKNRSHGLMMACERCGTWEHAECQGFRTNKQIPADYICSACVRAEGEEVIVIKCEEQGSGWNVDIEDFCTSMEVKEQENCDPVCCLCGCEDNEDFEVLIQPSSCDGSSTLAHPSCVAMAKVGISLREQRSQTVGSAICPFCGRQARDVGMVLKTQKGVCWMEEAIQLNVALSSGNSKSVKADQLAMARKRLRSTLASGGVPVKGEPTEKRLAKSSKVQKDQQIPHPNEAQPESNVTDLKKPSSPFLGRRFSDAAANVPIKKRRIQLEVARSPSPPSRSIAPSCEPDVAALNEVTKFPASDCSQSPEEANAMGGFQSEKNNPPCNGVVPRSNGCVKQGIAGNSGVVIENSELNDTELVIRDIAAFLSVRGSPQVDTTGHDGMSSGTRPDVCPSDKEGGVLPKLDLVGQGSIKNGQEESQPSKRGMDTTDNGMGSGSRRTEEGNSCASFRFDLRQQRVVPAQAGSANSNSEEGQSKLSKCIDVLSDHVSASSPSKTGDAGTQLDQAVQETTLGVRVFSSDLLKDISTDADLCCPVGDHVKVDEGPSVLKVAEDNCAISYQAHATSNTLEEQDSAMEEDKNVNVSSRFHWDLNMDMEEWERPPQENKTVTSDLDSTGLVENGRENNESARNEQVDQEEDCCESVAVASVSPVLQYGRMEPASLEVGTDTIKKAIFLDDMGGPLKPSLQMGAKHETSLILSVSCNKSLNLDQGVSIEKHAQVSLEHNGGIDRSTPAGCTKYECSNLSHDPQDCMAKTELQEGSGHRKLEENETIDVERKIYLHENSSSLVGSRAYRDGDGIESLGMDKISSNPAGCGSEVTDNKADVTCEDKVKDVFGPDLDRSTREADFLQSEQRVGLCVQSVSRREDLKEEIVSATVGPIATFPNSEASTADNVLQMQGVGKDEGPAFEDENVVDKEVMEESFQDQKESLSSPSRQGQVLQKWEGNISEDLEAENVDYDDSEIREGDDLELEEKLQCGGSEVESTWKPASLAGVCSHEEPMKVDANGASVSQCSTGDRDGGTDLNADCGRQSKRRNLSGSAGSGDNYMCMDHRDSCAGREDIQNCGSLILAKSSTNPNVDVNCVSTDEKGKVEHGNGSVSTTTLSNGLGSMERKEDMVVNESSERAIRKTEVWKNPSEVGSRVRSSGWDQLPEGFQSAEEALQAARGNAGHSGWGSQPWSGLPGSNANISAQFSSGNGRFVPGHGRGLLSGNGAASDRGRFEGPTWNRNDHVRRCRVEDGFDMNGRGSSTQDSRQGSRGRARSGVFESNHRPRRRDPWIVDSSNVPLWSFGPNRHLSPPGPLSEPFGFNPHKTRNAAAVAAAKVESSGLIVAPDGTVIKAGTAQASVRGISGVPAVKGRGNNFLGIGDMAPNRAIPGVGSAMLGGRMRIGDMELRGRECLGVDTRGAPGFGMGAQFSDAPLRHERVGDRYGLHGGESTVMRSSSGMPGTSSRFSWRREERSFASPAEQEARPFPGKRLHTLGDQPRSRSRPPRLSTSPGRPVITESGASDDGSASQSKKRSCTVAVNATEEHRPDMALEKIESPSHQVVAPPPKLPLPPPPPRAQRSPPAGLKRLINKREIDWSRGRDRNRDKEREWDRERLGSRGHYSPPRRTSPHVIHGSALTDERDRLLLAGIDRSRDQGASVPISSPAHGLRGKSLEVVHDSRKSQHDEGRKQDTGAQMSREEESVIKSRVQSKDVPMRGGDTKDRRLDTHLQVGREVGARTQSGTVNDTHRDGQKSGSSSKYSSSREGEDDVAPRRRRPSY